MKKKRKNELVLIMGSIGMANTYLFRNGLNSILVDCGRNKQVKNIIEVLGDLNMKKTDIKYMIITHVHFDHVAGLSKFKEEFPETKIVVSQREAKFLMEGAAPIPEGTGYWTNKLVSIGRKYSFLGKYFSKFPKVNPDILVEKELDLSNEMDYPVKVKLMKGHTDGSLSIIFGKNRYACVGDTCFRVYEKDVFPMYCNSKLELMRTWKRYIEMDIKKFYCGHHQYKPCAITRMMLIENFQKYSKELDFKEKLEFGKAEEEENEKIK